MGRGSSWEDFPQTGQGCHLSDSGLLPFVRHRQLLVVICKIQPWQGCHLSNRARVRLSFVRHRQGKAVICQTHTAVGCHLSVTDRVREVAKNTHGCSGWLQTNSEILVFYPDVCFTIPNSSILVCYKIIPIHPTCHFLSHSIMWGGMW